MKKRKNEHGQDIDDCFFCSEIIFFDPLLNQWLHEKTNDHYCQTVATPTADNIGR